MSNIWIYGCSFSEPFGLHDVAIINKDGTRDFFGVDYWGTNLAKMMNMGVINKALSGVGWNYILNQIDNDIMKWEKDDLIIISPSALVRVTILEFINHDVRHEYLGFYKPWTDVIQYNKNRWLTKIKTLQYLGYNVYTWVVDENTNDVTDLKNLILTPDNDINWKDWMDRHHEFWLDFNNNDWHFNEKGHIEVANTMYNFIKKENNENNTQTLG